MISFKKFSFSVGIIFMVSIFSVLAGCSGKITPENFDKLNSGMTYEQVQKIIGDPASCESNIGIKSCTWEEGEKNINVKFLADKVFLFSSNNL